MLEILNRKIAGDKVRLYAYDGKMRLRVSGTFYNAPNTAESIASAHSMALTRFADGSLSVDMQTLINSDATERQIEHRYEEILNKMEDVLGIEEGNCSSSGWFVGHGDSAYDYLMSDEERKFILSAVVDMSAAENEPEYAKMLAKPMADITEDIFLRPDVFHGAVV